MGSRMLPGYFRDFLENHQFLLLMAGSRAAFLKQCAVEHGCALEIGRPYVPFFQDSPRFKDNHR